ncbi:MAG: GxxExxY protein [Melioribacteraceae bacterium]|nr:GxxExxY protein [Melioribacteraceae bacterium]
MEILEKELTGKIIKAFYNVYNTLGYGFLEKVYERAMIIELKKFGLKSESQKQITVYYDEENVGEYFADILVEKHVIIELKAAESIVKKHETQLYNYLKATNVEVGLLMNFGEEAKFKRMVFENKFKKNPYQSV